MPRNSWTSLLEEGSFAGRSPASHPGSPPDTLLPQEVRRLQAQRRELEERMDRLTGRSTEPEARDRRFPVTPLAQRRAADDAWARRRDASWNPFSGGEGSQRSMAERVGGRLASDSGLMGEVEEPLPALRTGQRAILEPMGRIREGSLLEEPLSRPLQDRLRLDGDPVSDPMDRSMETRDRRRSPGDRFTGLGDRFSQVQDRFSEVSDRFTEVSTPTSAAAGRIRNASLRSLEREDERPRRVEDAYESLRDERLSLDRGGSGDLEERAARARARALEVRRAARELEAADDERVARARSRGADMGAP